MTIRRIWHGWTTKENADKYQDILNKEVLPGIEAKKIPGYRKIEVLKIDLKDEVEFVTIMTFNSIQNVIDFQGENYKKCYVPNAAQKVLKRWDQESVHYEIVETRNY
ncbi:antibiotic biosynthesis monooxygenase [Thermodesulfobacteriota bacterium]